MSASCTSLMFVFSLDVTQCRKCSQRKRAKGERGTSTNCKLRRRPQTRGSARPRLQKQREPQLQLRNPRPREAREGRDRVIAHRRVSLSREKRRVSTTSATRTGAADGRPTWPGSSRVCIYIKYVCVGCLRSQGESEDQSQVSIRARGAESGES